MGQTSFEVHSHAVLAFGLSMCFEGLHWAKCSELKTKIHLKTLYGKTAKKKETLSI